MGGWVQVSLLTFAHLCRSYPRPGSIAMIAFLHASRFCARFGSRCMVVFQLAQHTVHPSQSGPSSRSLPSHLHCCYLLCNMCFFSSHYMAIPREAFLVVFNPIRPLWGSLTRLVLTALRRGAARRLRGTP